MRWNESFLLGVMMNTRGLMELIVLNIGYDLGIMSSQMFAILVLMALLTTVMTSPLLGYPR
jgi:Kef-type K+ transport system membrane component KefB